MDIKSKFEFISSFKKIISVDFFHNYFNDGKLNFFDIITDSKTLSLMKNYGLVFRKKNDGFIILSDSNERFKSSSFNDTIKLNFFLYFKDNFFLNYTDLPFNNYGLLLFENKYGELLHSNEFVDSKNTLESEEKLTGQICLTLNETYGFFGNVPSKKSQNNISYKISFKSRDIYIRYNLILKNNNIDTYYVTNEEEEYKLSNFAKRVSPSGKEIYSLILEDKINSKETYQLRYLLKKDDDFFKSFSLPLPQPTAKNISYDKINKIFIADIYITVD